MTENVTNQSSDVKYRRKVFEIIETLCETINSEKLKEFLPFLHKNSWDEVVEERYVNNTCGYPTCSRNCRPNQNRQMYHIDRKSGKIFENCKLRNKFCSDTCFEKSAKIQQQLFDEAIWITGEIVERMSKNYIIPAELIVEINEEPKQQTITTPVKASTPKKVVEVVEDSILAQMTSLRIRDEENDKDSENSEDDDDLKHIQPYEKCSDDEDFAESVARFISERNTPKCVEKSSKPAPKPIPKTNTKKQDEILEKLRQKYKNGGGFKRPPIIIQPPKKLETPEVKLVEFKRDPKVDWVKQLLKEWITSDTKELILTGARYNGGDIEKVLMGFLTGKHEENEKSVNLPKLDKYNIKEKRINIFMQSIRHNWSDIEARLHLNQTRRDLISRIIATFNLTSENITGWTKSEAITVAFSLFLLTCFVDAELEDEFCQNGRISPELSTISSKLCNIDSSGLTDIYSTIRKLIS